MNNTIRKLENGDFEVVYPTKDSMGPPWIWLILGLTVMIGGVIMVAIIS